MKFRKLFLTLTSVATAAIIFSSCGKSDVPPADATPAPTPTPVPVAEVKDDIFYTNMTTSKTRPIAVMIDNDSKARPQTGLENAFAVYEMVVEGTYTRLMAVFKDCPATKIGPVRSSRHYFLDYALEHDAIYAHCGYSPQAQKDLSSLHVSNVNEISSNNGKNYYRDTQRKAPHNLYTSLPELISSINGIYNTTTEYGNVFSYNPVDTELTSDITATKISIPYFNEYTVSYEYDAEKKLYTRLINSTPHTTASDGSALLAKNIIVYQIKNYGIDNYGRQNLDTVGFGNGWYISNGKSTPIKWQKDSRGSKTVYTTESGEALNINPGNVYVQIVPVTSNITIE